jgi:hypothetical protein
MNMRSTRSMVRFSHPSNLAGGTNALLESGCEILVEAEFLRETSFASDLQEALRWDAGTTDTDNHSEAALSPQEDRTCRLPNGLSYGFGRLPRYWKPLHATPFMACSGGGWIVSGLVY